MGTGVVPLLEGLDCIPKAHWLGEAGSLQEHLGQGTRYRPVCLMRYCLGGGVSGSRSKTRWCCSSRRGAESSLCLGCDLCTVVCGEKLPILKRIRCLSLEQDPKICLSYRGTLGREGEAHHCTANLLDLLNLVAAQFSKQKLP